MDRRNFFKIVSTVSAGVAGTACGKKTDTLIPLLVPDHEIAPGEEQWHPSVCVECSAGCGTIVRVMEGEHTIERDGKKLRESIACVKKIEGNPLDQVSGGRLCARGHAGLQSLYHPDRVRGPMRRTGPRGNAEFIPLSWKDAIASVAERLLKVRSDDASKIVFLTGPQLGARALAIAQFLESLGAPPAITCSLGSLTVERKAAELVFGWKGVPIYDLAQARYTLGVGADFLGGWASPVYYARQFGHFRQGRPGLRGTLVQAESRMSITASSADQWLPVRPGFEAHLLVAISRLLLDAKLARNAEQLPASVRAAIDSADLGALFRATAIEEKRLRQVTQQLGESEAPLVIAGASIIHSNSLDSIIASHYLNLMLGSIGRSGGVLPPNPEPAPVPQNRNVSEALKSARILLLDNENPAYSLPPSSGAHQALAKIENVVSFGPFIDDSVAYADLIVPDNHALESDRVLVPVVTPGPAFIVATAFVRPLHNTRPLEQTLLEISRQMGRQFDPGTSQSYVQSFLPAGQQWADVARDGGLWLGAGSETQAVEPLLENIQMNDPALAGAPDQFPLQFQPYLSLQYHDGRSAHLPWMQELPDPTSSAMWDLPIEIDPQTAARNHVATGDWVRVESVNGTLEAPVYVHPAALPGVASMAIGEGHSHYGRYASGRGANPLSILAPKWEPSTGALAFGATRVRIARLDQRPRELIQFSPKDTEQGPWGYR